MVEATKIFIYILEFDKDKHCFIPKLESTLYNYMNCSQLNLSRSGEFALAFKYDQKGLQVFERKYEHSFKVCLDTTDYEGTIALRMNKSKNFILGDDKRIKLFDQKHKDIIQLINIEGRPEEEEIVSMTVSHDETRVAAALGKISYGADETITCLIIYEYI